MKGCNDNRGVVTFAALSRPLGATMISLLIMLASGTFYTGNELYAKCDDPTQQAFCMSYVAGAFDMMSAFNNGGATSTFCTTEGGTVRQITDIAIKYMRDHPETRNQYAPILIFNAVRGAFPCPKAAK